MLNGGKQAISKNSGMNLNKNESSEDLMRQELDEGRASYMTEFNIRSPNIQKKRMEFGNSSGTSGLMNEYVWQFSKKNYNNQDGITLETDFTRLDVRVSKIADKWARSIVLDKKGKLYQWQSLGRFDEDSKQSQHQPNEEKLLQEIQAQIDGKPLQRQVIKDIACNSSCLFLATENGEVLIGKVKNQEDENDKVNNNNAFEKRLNKIRSTDKISFSFFKMNSIQSHFISQISCGNNHAILLTSSGFVYSFGKNHLGQLGHPSQSEDLNEPLIIFSLLNLKVFSIACGKHHNIVIGSSRDTMASTFQIYSTQNALFTTIDKNKTLVYSWGNNTHGQLGLNDTNDRNTPTLVESVLDYNFKKAHCGSYHSGLLEENGCLFMFGSNQFGQTGVNSEQDQLEPQSLFSYYEQSNEEGSTYKSSGHQDQFQMIITKFILDFNCSSNSTICYTDEQEVLLWGKNFFDTKEAQNFYEPVILLKIDESILNRTRTDSQIVDRIQTLKNEGLLIFSRQKTDKDESAGNSGQKSDVQDQSFASSYMNRDHSFQMSQGNSFLKNQNYGSGRNGLFQMPQNSGQYSTGISFNKEFENLLQYIAITAGNTNMPDGIKPMTFRPNNLPPKTNEEEKLHQKLVEDNRKQYLKKVRDREKMMEKKRVEQEKREKRLQEMKEIWENDLLPNWDQVKRTKRVRELWIEGLPSVIRGKVWFYAFGNRNSISKDFYYIMADKGKKLRKLLKEITIVDQEIIDNGGQPRTGYGSSDKENENLQSSGLLTEEQKLKQGQQAQFGSPKLQELNQRYDKLRNKLNFLIGIENQTIQNRERSISIIETDLPRTFPLLGLFKQGGMHYEQLQRILEAFTLHRPDIGYVQGMSYVAAALLLYMDEHSAFITFCNMITKYPIMPFYTFNEIQIRKLLQLFKQVFQHNLPDLCEHLESENIQPKQYVYEWFMTVFTRALNISLLSRVWDFYFLDGIFVLFQTAIAILRILEKPLLQQDFEGIMKIIKNVSDYVNDEEELVSFIYDVSYPKWIYDELPKLEFEFLKQI